MPTRNESPTDGKLPDTLFARLRRRTGRVGAAVVVLASLTAAVVVFAVCACKTVR